MCGIAGIVSLDGRPVDEAEVRAMVSVMTHRGPDDEGIHAADGAVLGMRRLSIVDVAAGQQPLCDESGQIWAVCNGEIYNFRELRSDLERGGHRFRTGSDAETIVHLYEERGTRCVEALRGMFALAVWDAKRRRLLLARDRLGIKPLYYALSDGRLVFGSELKSVLQVPAIERRLNVRALDHLFTTLCTPGDASIVESVRKLEPARLLIVEPGRAVRIEPYWELRFEPQEGRSADDLAEGLRARIDESVRLHLVGEVPIGAFLSGGIDSSAVVAAMAGAVSGRIKTFSIGFDDQDYDELRYARMVADRFGTDHHEMVVKPDVSSLIEDLAWYLDEPFGDSSAIPTYLV
jgi:asparagine synthase (glutamine-hydrolysing)